MSEKENGDEKKTGGRISRRAFVGGVAVGAAGAWGLSYGLDRLGRDLARPPALYEYFLDNFWFKAADLENQEINAPLKGTHKADIAIIGGGFTGMASAYNLALKFPQKKIVLLEGACCGYGASGRNGGFCSATSLIGYDKDPEVQLREIGVSMHGIGQVKKMISEHGIDCDFEESGTLNAAINDEQAAVLEEHYEKFKALGLEATMLHGEDLKAEINSPRFIAGMNHPYGGILNPAKLARGMKPLIEKLGVEVRERTVVMRVTPGKTHRIETEMGEISAPILVLGLNGYSQKIGFFKNRVWPLCNYVIATEPLSKEQWKAIGWRNRQGLSDLRVLFDYLRPSADGRIVIGGGKAPYFARDGLSSGNYKPSIKRLIDDLFATFPQLEGLRIDHAWGGTMAVTLDFTPSVGVIGEHKNIYYGAAYNEGVPTTQTAGCIIAELIAGEVSELTKHFIVNHKIPYSGPQNLRKLFVDAYEWYLTRFFNVSQYR